MSRAEVHRYLCKFRLIAAGLLKSAEEVDDIRPSNHSSTKTSEPNDSSDSESDDRSLIAIRNEFFRRALRNSVEATPSAATMTKKLNVEMAYKSVMKVFLADMTRGQKCSNCGGSVYTLQVSFEFANFTSEFHLHTGEIGLSRFSEWG